MTTTVNHVLCLIFLSVLWESGPDVTAQKIVIPTIYPVELNNTEMSMELSSLPMVAKCCDLDQVLSKNVQGESTCVTWDKNDSSVPYFSPFFSEFNRSGLTAPGDKKKQFVAVVGNPCRNNRYILDPQESSDDEYYLLMNGSIFAPHHVPLMLSPRIDYCMEVVPNLGLRALVCFPEDADKSDDLRMVFYALGLLISVPFLTLTIVAYSITPRLRDIHGKALCHYCGCLAIAFTSLAIVQLTSSYICDEICISIAFVIQFSFVACFFWLNVMCIETWMLVKRHTDGTDIFKIEKKKLFFYYSIWGWGPPAILIFVSMVMDLSPMVPITYVKPNFGRESCWFNSDEGALPYFYVPVGILVLANLVLFGLTAVGITKYQRELDLRILARNEASDREELRVFRRLKRTFFVCVGLFFLMGMNWAMELISWWAGGNPLAWSAFDFVNALQGVLVFGLFVLRKPIRGLVWYRVQRLLGRTNTTVEPDVASMDLHLLPMSNGDTLPR